MRAIYTVCAPEMVRTHWEFVEQDGTLYPVVWEDGKYLPWDLEDDIPQEEKEIMQFAEEKFDMPVEDGGVDGADIDVIECDRM